MRWDVRAFERPIGHVAWRQCHHSAHDGHFRAGTGGEPLNSWRGVLVLTFAMAGVAGMFVPFTARFFALVIPTGEMLRATMVALALSAIMFALCIWLVPKLPRIVPYFKKTRQS